MLLTIYGSTQCPDTQACLAACEEKALDFVFRDIADLAALKEFLLIRDKEPLFDAVKQAGGVGIPLVLKGDGSCTLDWESAVQ